MRLSGYVQNIGGAEQSKSIYINNRQVKCRPSHNLLLQYNFRRVSLTKLAGRGAWEYVEWGFCGFASLIPRKRKRTMHTWLFYGYFPSVCVCVASPFCTFLYRLHIKTSWSCLATLSCDSEDAEQAETPNEPTLTTLAAYELSFSELNPAVLSKRREERLMSPNSG